MRRVEALVGIDAFRYLAREHVLVSQLAGVQGAARGAAGAHRGHRRRLREAERELEKLRADAVLASAGALADGADDLGGVALVRRAPDGIDGNDLRALATDIRGRLGDRPGVVALFPPDGERVSVVVATTEAPGTRASPPASSCRRSPRRWAAAAAASRTSPRAAASDPAGVAGRRIEALRAG